MKSLSFGLLLAFICVFFVGCGGVHPFVASVTRYHQGDFENSEAFLKDYVKDKKALKDPSYPLMLLALADAQFRLGDYQSALKTYQAALQNAELEKSTLAKGAKLLIAERKRPYNVRSHQLALMHYYMGLCYYMMEDYEGARIEFSQCRLEDLGAEQGQEDDITCAIFMMGMTYLKLGDLNKAIPDFRKVTELSPDFPFGWYAAAVLSDKLGDKEDGNWNWEKYAGLVPPNQRLARDIDAPCIFVILDAGFGPYRTVDSRYTFIWHENPGVGLASQIELTALPDNRESAYTVTNTGFQASTEGGVLKSELKRGLLIAIKMAINQLSSTFLGTEIFDLRADTRMWYTLSGQLTMGLIPADPGNYVLNVKFKNEVKKRKGQTEMVDVADQTLNCYYIRSDKFSETKPVCLVSKPHLHDTLITKDKVPLPTPVRYWMVPIVN